MSKYILAVKAIGKPCSPKQVRTEVNIHEEPGDEVTSQNTASALNNLLSRGQLVRGEDGLYDLPKEKEESEVI